MIRFSLKNKTKLLLKPMEAFNVTLKLCLKVTELLIPKVFFSYYRQNKRMKHFTIKIKLFWGIKSIWIPRCK